MAGRKQFTLKATWFGFIVMVRSPVPASAYGDWEWGKWRRAGIGELAEIMKRLRDE